MRGVDGRTVTSPDSTADVDHALRLKRDNPGWLAMGENGGSRIDGFDLSNSPVEASLTNMDGRTIVQRTSAGTRGANNATNAKKIWCASLVCATATANVVNNAGLGDPTYVITGDWPERDDLNGYDDRVTAQFIETVRQGAAADPAQAARDVTESDEAARTLAQSKEHVHPADVEYATRVDCFDFAMEATREEIGLVLRRT